MCVCVSLWYGGECGGCGDVRVYVCVLWYNVAWCGIVCRGVFMWCVLVHVGRQRTTHRGHNSPFTLWVPGSKLISLVARIFTH